MTTTVPPSSVNSAHEDMAVEIEAIKVLEGYLSGFRQPVWIATVRVSQDIDDAALEAFDVAMMGVLRAHETAPIEAERVRHPVAARLIEASCAILAAGGMPVLGMPQTIADTSPGSNRFRLVVPTTTCDDRLARAVVSWPIALLNSLAGGQIPDMVRLGADADRLAAHVTAHAPSQLKGLFLQAAHEQAVPWRHVVNDVFQFGWGRRGRLLEGSFTDETAAISVTLARNKLACAKVLGDAGLPVPRHYRVADLREALAAADALGYPVVVKPVNLDGGEGVFAGLKDAQALRKAYAQTAELSRAVMVEKHFEGQDYRLQVFGDAVYWIAHRRPAYVVGDGKATIAALAERTNRARARETVLDPTREQGNKPILIDEEVTSWIADQGLEPSSVPPLGKHVRLRGAANVASGGTRAPVPPEQAHPDNLALAVRAARVLRLDLAGIDLLIPDITRSWIDTGAVICEVNAKPQMSHHLPPAVLSRLVEGEGRIPVVGVLGDIQACRWFDAIAKAAADSGTCLGLATSAGAWMDGRPVAIGAPGVCRAATGLLADPRLDALLIELQGLSSMGSGSPVDRMDALVFAPDPAALEPPPDDRELGAALVWTSAFAREVWVGPHYHGWQETLQRSGMTVRLLSEESLGQRLELTLLNAAEGVSEVDT